MDPNTENNSKYRQVASQVKNIHSEGDSQQSEETN